MFKLSHRATFLALAVAATALAGCASSGTKQSASTTPAPTSPSESGGVSTSGTNGTVIGNGSPTGTTTSSAASKLSLPTLHSAYFDTDKSFIKPKYQSLIGKWASYLDANPGTEVQIQGNCDERGTEEYNMALGERRAVAVEKALEADGASASQLSTISYGKDRPVCTQHDEACWWQNRRADIVVQ